MRTPMRILVSAVVIALALMWALPAAHTESNSGLSPKSARLNFQVQIPAIVFLRIGSLGATIDTVSFNVTDFPDVVPTVAGDITPVVRVMTLLAGGHAVNLTANSSTAMTAPGSSTPMPFTTISYQGTGDFAAVSGAFSGGAAQSIWNGTGSVNLSGTFAYTYTNSLLYDPGIYTGQVTYTLASP